MRELFVTCASNGGASRVYICAAAAEYLRGPIKVLAGEGVVALVNDPAGALDIRPHGHRTRAIELAAESLARFLTKHLQVPMGQRISAFYDKELDALVVGPGEKLAAMRPELLTPASPQRVRQVSCWVEEDRLVLDTHLPARSNALICGDMLALHREESEGQVLVEPNGARKMIRRPDVVEFCRDHWQGREVYARMMGDSTVLSWDLVGLSLLRDTKSFRPLRVARRAAMDLRRDRSIFLNTEAARLLHGKLSAYVCGPTVALIKDPAGDIAPHPEDGGAAIRSMRLYWHITRSYPLSNRLYFHSRGNLLVLSQEQGDVLLPPEEDFCRLLTGPGGRADTSTGRST